MRSAVRRHVTCDLCGANIVVKHLPFDVPAYLPCEEIEGRGYDPHYRTMKLDLCEACLKDVTKVTAYGACGSYSLYVDGTRRNDDYREWLKNKEDR